MWKSCPTNRHFLLALLASMNNRQGMPTLAYGSALRVSCSLDQHVRILRIRMMCFIFLLFIDGAALLNWRRYFKHVATHTFWTKDTVHSVWDSLTEKSYPPRLGVTVNLGGWLVESILSLTCNLCFSIIKGSRCQRRPTPSNGRPRTEVQEVPLYRRWLYLAKCSRFAK